MAQNSFWYRLLDDDGVPISGADVYVYKVKSSDTLTLFNVTGGSLSQPLTTDSNGAFQFFVKDKIEDAINGYDWEQEFRIKWKKGDEKGTIQGDHLFGEYDQIDINSNDNVKNKAISNDLARIWNEHVDRKY